MNGENLNPRSALRERLVNTPRVVKLGAAALALTAAGFAAASPLAMEKAVTDTQVIDNIAGAPTLLTYSKGESQLDAGLAGRAYAPISKYGIGISAEFKDPPRVNGSGPLSFITPDYMAELAGLYHKPEKAIEGIANVLAAERNANFKENLLLFGLPLSAGFLYLNRRHIMESQASQTSRQKLTMAALLAIVAAAPSAYAAYDFNNWQGSNPPVSDTRFSLITLDDTTLEEVTVSNNTLQLAIDQGVPKAKVVLARQEVQKTTFISRAEANLLSQTDKIHGPSEGQTMVLIGSDSHGSEAMTYLAGLTVDTVNDLFGESTLSTTILSGDVSPAGSGAEEPFVKQQASISKTIVVSPGNHDTEIAQKQMDDAGMEIVLSEPVVADELRIGGGEDPNVTPFGQPTVPRDETNNATTINQETGEALYKKELASPVNITAVHEGYVAGAYMGLGRATQLGMTDWFSEKGTNTIPYEDGIRDLPTSLLMYGHWHRDTMVRVVWNEDGSHTAVFELNSLGGASANPTANQFSLPNGAPIKRASFATVCFDNKNKLVTGYQLFRFETNGEVSVGEFIPIGPNEGDDESHTGTTDMTPDKTADEVGLNPSLRLAS